MLVGTGSQYEIFGSDFVPLGKISLLMIYFVSNQTNNNIKQSLAMHP